MTTTGESPPVGARRGASVALAAMSLAGAIGGGILSTVANRRIAGLTIGIFAACALFGAAFGFRDRALRVVTWITALLGLIVLSAQLIAFLRP